MKKAALGLGAVAAGLLGAVGTSIAGALPAGATAQTFSQHQLVPIDGATVTCGTTALVAAGSFEQVVHGTLDAQGIFHITGTGISRAVTLDDGAGNVYSLHGATHFGATFTDPDSNSPIAMTSTDKFSIVRAGGGLLGSVNVTEHVSRNGQAHSFDFGSCQPPR
jgi:hypothetical protein